jgi:plastocyanin
VSLVVSKSVGAGRSRLCPAALLAAGFLLLASPVASGEPEAASPGVRGGSAASAPGRSLASAPGSIRGTVRILEKRLFGGVRPARSHAGVLVSVSGFGSPPPEALAELRQRDERFVPHVLPVVVGQRVRFPNDDEIYHNVFSVAPGSRFDLGHYKGSDPPGEVVVEQPGIVPVYCNIHPEMIAYVVVLENAAFAFSDAEGRFEIRGVPPGSHVVEAWIPRATKVALPIEVGGDQATAVELEVEQILKVAPHRRKDGSHYPPPDDPYAGEAD